MHLKVYHIVHWYSQAVEVWSLKLYTFKFQLLSSLLLPNCECSHSVRLFFGQLLRIITSHIYTDELSSCACSLIGVFMGRLRPTWSGTSHRSAQSLDAHISVRPSRARCLCLDRGRRQYYWTSGVRHLLSVCMEQSTGWSAWSRAQSSDFQTSTQDLFV